MDFIQLLTLILNDVVFLHDFKHVLCAYLTYL